jgi:hypothetical protein
MSGPTAKEIKIATRAVRRISFLFYFLEWLTAVVALLGDWFVDGQRVYLSTHRADDGSTAKSSRGNAGAT